MNRTAIGAMIGLAGVLALISLAFVLPMKLSGAHHLPIGIAGPAATGEQFENAVRAQAGDMFDVRHYNSVDNLRSGIEDREVVGGMVVTADGSTVFVTSAGGTPIAQALRGVAAAMSPVGGPPIPVEDVVPTTADDPQGAGISGLALPLVLGGIIPAVAFSRLIPGKPLQQGAAAVGMAVLAGFALGLLLRFAIGTFEADVIAVSLGISLGMAAISLTLIGLQANLGIVGFGAGAVIMMIVGNPLSGIATSAYWLPSGWAELGQLLPPGASGTLLRSLAYFGGHGGVHAFIVLVCWTAVGTGLIILARRRSPSPITADGAEALQSTATV